MYKLIIKKINVTIRHIFFMKRWRDKNQYNFTHAGNIFPIDKVKVGNMTYGKLNISSYGNPNEKLTIGSFCSIAGNVRFLLGGEHDYKCISTYPFSKYIEGLEEITITKGEINVCDDVWIGEQSLILSGITIGQGAIIAAGSVVSKDVPPYAIFAGGRIVKYRFSDETIKILNQIDYSKLSIDEIKNFINDFKDSLDEDNIMSNKFVNSLIRNE